MFVGVLECHEVAKGREGSVTVQRQFYAYIQHDGKGYLHCRPFFTTVHPDLLKLMDEIQQVEFDEVEQDEWSHLPHLDYRLLAEETAEYQRAEISMFHCC